MPLINLFTTMYFYFGILNFYANAIVFVNKLYISEDMLWCFYFEKEFERLYTAIQKSHVCMFLMLTKNAFTMQVQ